jgi:hypothetical protein
MGQHHHQLHTVFSEIRAILDEFPSRDARGCESSPGHSNFPKAVKDVAAGRDDMTLGLNYLSSHLRSELGQVMSRVRPKDLSVVEVAAVLAVLAPADARVIGGPASRPDVRVLRVGGEHPASDLAE